jgi:hypothetical protein
MPTPTTTEVYMGVPYADPPVYICSSVCSTLCHVCDGRWYEGDITTFECQCGELRLCPKCAHGMQEPVEMEHNLVNCRYTEPE